MPRPSPSGRGLPQEALSAASCRTPFKRAVSRGSESGPPPNCGILRDSPISFKRNASGSCPAVAASSSTKLSTTKPLLECSTERHQARGALECAKVYSIRIFGDLYGTVAPVPNSPCPLSSSPFGLHLAAIEVEVWKCFHAARFPSASTMPWHL